MGISLSPPRYNRRRGSGNIRSSTNLQGRVGRRTGHGAVYADYDFSWFGDQIENDVDEALIEAMDLTLDQAVHFTQTPGWTPYRTGDLMRSIQKLSILARKNRIIGDFGSGLHYALYQELGTIQFGGRFYLTRAGTLAAGLYMFFLDGALKRRGY